MKYDLNSSNNPDLMFTITDRAKKKARRRRVRGERKWRALRILSFVFLAVFAGVVALLVLQNDQLGFGTKTLCYFGIAAGVTGFVVCRSFLLNFTRHWIHDRLHEAMWIKDDVLYYLFQHSYATPWNMHKMNPGSAALYIIEISRIKDPKHDPKSGQINLLVSGQFRHFSNVVREEYDEISDMSDWPVVLFDYTSPSLYEELKVRGVQFQETALTSKVTDSRV